MENRLLRFASLTLFAIILTTFGIVISAQEENISVYLDG